eukprot:NODE_1513_length_844_cov_144.217610_g1257_i0.p1 GENE.NODE_1513_length_844_cov_144.217610_g1257_i0~~NODE_1513_length_844_cov_144.217610_g1257_i0.p1  ORF type:complete len:222 (+),score=61.54 NODE_1513_length_844_cov_144.217610_g1257_i0:31-666(+)
MGKAAKAAVEEKLEEDSKKRPSEPTTEEKPAKASRKKAAAKEAAPEADSSEPSSATSLFEFSTKNLDGSPLPFASLKGQAKAILLFNHASACGYTKRNDSQMEGLYQKYKDKGLVVIAVPCNDFGNQERGDSAKITTFCREKYSFTFPITEKVSVKGKGATDFMKFLQEKTVAATWNFWKFLVDKEGVPVKAFKSGILPDDIGPEIEKLLQ